MKIELKNVHNVFQDIGCKLQLSLLLDYIMIIIKKLIANVNIATVEKELSKCNNAVIAHCKITDCGL